MTKSNIHPWTNPLFLHCNGGREQLGSILRMVRSGEIRVPHYQRGRVWTDEQKSLWVGHVLSGAPLPSIFIRDVNGPSGFEDEIVDGQQRLMACIDWLDGKVAAPTWDGGVARCESRADAVMLKRVGIPVSRLPVGTSEADVLRLYLALNNAGTPHTAEELGRVRGLLAEVEP